MEKVETSFNIVLLEPEIPQNTGNIGRVCVGFNCHLHVVGPLGFELSDKQVKRAGLDYWQHLSITQYEDWSQFYPKIQSVLGRVFFLSTKVDSHLYGQDFQVGDWFIFGKETKGIEKSILDDPAPVSYTHLTLPTNREV